MKYILIIPIVLWVALCGGFHGPFSGVSFAESGYEVIGTNPPEYEDEEDEPDTEDITKEMIDEEEEWLEKKIDEINETPVEKFGSLVHKSRERAYYATRLELLRDDPEKYFKTKKSK